MSPRVLGLLFGGQLIVQPVELVQPLDVQPRLAPLVAGMGWKRGNETFLGNFQSLGVHNPAPFIAVGDAVDFWRVEEVRPGQLLRLRAEMRVPGRAWLQYEIAAEADGSRLVQTAFFEPRGLSGRLYWYALLPAHLLIFRGSIRELARRAERSRPERSAASVAGGR